MVDISSHVARLRGLFEGSRLRARSLRATVLVTGAFGLAKLVQLASNLILTRLLFPEAFGLMALVSVFITGIDMLSDVGVRPSVVRSERGNEPDFLSTAWTVNVIRGLWITVLACILAWPYSLIYGEPILFHLICVSALGAAIGGFASIGGVVRVRELMLGRVVTLQLVAQSLSVSLTVLFAWWTQSVWGLAIGNVAGAIVRTVLTHLLLPSPHHRFMWDRSVVSEIVRFGRWILLGTFFTFFGTKGVQAVRGTLVDLDTLGFLHIASMFATMLVDLAARLLSSVGFPAISDVARRRPQDLRNVVGRMRNLQILFTLPAFFLLAMIAQPMVSFLYDDRYSAAGTYLAFMALSSAIGVLPMVYQNAFLALGDSRAHAAVMLSLSALTISGTFVGHAFGGVVGMLVADAVAASIVFALSVTIAVRKGIANPRIDVIAYVAILIAYGLLWSVMA